MNNDYEQMNGQLYSIQSFLVWFRASAGLSNQLYSEIIVKFGQLVNKGKQECVPFSQLVAVSHSMQWLAKS